MYFNDWVEDGYGQVARLTITEDDTAVDISAFTTTKQIIFKGPDGKLVTKTATFYTDGTDGIVQCTIADGDIDKKGNWQCQARIVSSAQDLYTNPFTFEVYERLQ